MKKIKVHSNVIMEDIYVIVVEKTGEQLEKFRHLNSAEMAVRRWEKITYEKCVVKNID